MGDDGKEIIPRNITDLVAKGLELRMDNREKLREAADRGPMPKTKSFQFWDIVRIYDTPGENWKTVGTVIDTRRLGSSGIHSYYGRGRFT